jgi:hypothetical protein
MANFRVRIIVEQTFDIENDGECYVDYYCSVGKKNAKIPSSVLLDIVEAGMKKEVKDKLGTEMIEK